MHQSNHTYSEQKRKAEEDSIKIDIDEEIEEDFEQDFNQHNRKSMKNIESRVELISSSLNQNNQLKSALDGVRKFVQQQDILFKDMDKNFGSKDKEVIQEVKKNQKSADRLIDKMDVFIDHQNIEKKLDILIS